MLSVAVLAVMIHLYIRIQCCNECIAFHQRVLAAMVENLPRVERAVRLMKEHPEQILGHPEHGFGNPRRIRDAIEKKRSLIREYERTRWMFWQGLPDDPWRERQRGASRGEVR
jgi:hypothetical protein